MKIASNNFFSRSPSKHYTNVEPFIRIANLLPWSIRNGVRQVDLGDGQFVAEAQMPGTEAIRNLPQSPLSLRMLKDRQKIVAGMKKLDPAKKRAALNEISENLPSATQLRIFEAVRARFMRRFPEGRVEIGPQGWLLRGNPFALYAVYTAIVEAFTDIAEGSIQIGREHVAAFSIPFSVPKISIVWDHDRPTIEFVSNILLDGFRAALTGFDPRRIKRCPVCGAFFLAWRLGKGACSPACLNVNRVRRHRMRSEQYELARKLWCGEIPPRPLRRGVAL